MVSDSTKLIEEALEKYMGVEVAEEKKEKSPKEAWVERMVKSAKQYHKRCPYFDHKTKICFVTLGEKCTRDGRFEGCNVFEEFLAKKYEEFKSKNRPLPTDFLDIGVGI